MGCDPSSLRPKVTLMTTIYSLLSEIQNGELSKSTNRQLKALVRITDLFAAGSGNYSAKQIELFDEVFKALIVVIELKTRVRLAEHIAICSDAPLPLVRELAFDDDIAVAGPVLSQSNVLTDSDIVRGARTKSQGHLYAIAQRQTLSEAITDILIERGERNVVRAVAKNVGARISDRGFSELVLRSGDDSELALHIGLRRDIPRHHFVRLLEIVSAEVCSRIIAADSQVSGLARDAVTEVIDEINDQVRDVSTDHAKAKRKIRRLKYWKELGEGKVQAAARAQDFEQAVLALSVLARCPIEVAERAVLNENPGPIQIVGKAAGCAWPTIKALLLMTAADRKMSKMDLDRAQENYGRLEVRTAKRVLEFYESRSSQGAAAKPVVSEPSANAPTLAPSDALQVRNSDRKLQSLPPLHS
jgi:uncharacterized protein (DUF2336 family)